MGIARRVRRCRRSRSRGINARVIHRLIITVKDMTKHFMILAVLKGVIRLVLISVLLTLQRYGGWGRGKVKVRLRLG